MRKSVKIWLIIASALVALGSVLFVAVMSVYRWDFTKLSLKKLVTKEYTVQEDFSEITIRADTTDISLLPSEDGVCRIVSFEYEGASLIGVQNGKLSVEESENGKWYERIFDFSEPKMTVYLPVKEYARMQIETSTGDIQVKNATVGELDISVSTGDITVSKVVCTGEIKIVVTTGDTELTSVSCKSFSSQGSTGDLELEKVIAEERLFIKRNTGDVEFDGCDAGEIFVQTTTGDVEGSLLSGKRFVANSRTGKVQVPKPVEGGTCEIQSDTGDIILRVLDEKFVD